MRSTNSRAAIRAARTAWRSIAAGLSAAGLLVLLALDPAALTGPARGITMVQQSRIGADDRRRRCGPGDLAGLILHTRGIRGRVLRLRSSPGSPMISLVLGLASYWDCHDRTHPSSSPAHDRQPGQGVSVNSRSPLGGARRHRRSPRDRPPCGPWRPCSSAWSALPRRAVPLRCGPTPVAFRAIGDRNRRRRRRRGIDGRAIADTIGGTLA